MRSKLRFLWVVPVLALGSGLFLGAADEPGSPAKGTVLILRTERTLEGDIHRDRKRDEYIIKKNISQITIPARSVLRLCIDWEDAYEFMKGRVKTGDVEGKVKLARWCDINDLHQEALTEAEAALNLKPDHQEAKQLCVIFERRLKDLKDRPAESTAAPEPPPVPEVEIDPEAKSFFSKRVQPILVQRCLECHNPTRSSKFQLHRPYEGTLIQTTMRNLHAAVGLIDRERPEHSELLDKANRFHAGNMTQPPIRSKNDPQFAALKNFVELVVASPVNLPERRDWRREKGSGVVTSTGPQPKEKPLPRVMEQEPADPEPTGFELPGGRVVSNGGLATPLAKAEPGGLSRQPFASAPDPGRALANAFSPNARDDIKLMHHEEGAFGQNSMPNLPPAVTTVVCNRPPPFPPTWVGRPELACAAEVQSMAEPRKGPRFPPIAGPPQEFAVPLRQRAILLEPAPPKGPPAQSRMEPQTTAAPAFRFMPAPTPTVEAVRPEQASDEFDPMTFNRLK